MKRNLKALRRLRTVFAKTNPHEVHMRQLIDKTSCGTARCLLGWGHTDIKLREMGLRPSSDHWRAFGNAVRVFGLDRATAAYLFAYNRDYAGLDPLCRNPHGISKRQVLAKLDAVIAGKLIKPYVVKSA